MPKKQRNHPARKNKHSQEKNIIIQLGEDDIIPYIQEQEEEPFILIIDGIQDAHNLGACLRSAEAAGIQVVIAPQKHTIGLTETVRRIACGSADKIPYVQVHNLNQILLKLREIGITIVGTGDQGAEILYEVDLKGPLAIVIGSEAHGIHTKVAEKCDSLVRIPMLGSGDCLNLSVATGICLFEAVRQRNFEETS